MHPRGASLPDILTAVSDRTDKKDLRVFTEKPGTKSSVRQHIMQNTMRKAPCSFSHWLGEPVDIYFYPPPTVLVPGSARNKGNVAADALMINFDADKLTVDSHPVQPHGLCLVVGAGNLDDGDPPPRGIDVTKEMLCKLAATIGQLTPFLGDREKMEMVKKHWRWYDPAKGDQIEASGEVSEPHTVRQLVPFVTCPLLFIRASMPFASYALRQLRPSHSHHVRDPSRSLRYPNPSLRVLDLRSAVSRFHSTA